MQLTVALVCSLVAVPVALSGHHHQASQAAPSDTCAACVATRLTPVVNPPPVPHVAPVLRTSTVATPPVVVAARDSKSPRTGRAPPLTPLTAATA
jgi:hypothetical protein